jgi:hypothetical protein
MQVVIVHQSLLFLALHILNPDLFKQLIYVLLRIVGVSLRYCVGSSFPSATLVPGFMGAI